MQRTGTICTILVEGHTRIIAVKFHEDRPSGSGEEVVRRKKLTDGRTHARTDGRTTDDGHLGITKAHIEHVVLR